MLSLGESLDTLGFEELWHSGHKGVLRALLTPYLESTAVLPHSTEGCTRAESAALHPAVQRVLYLLLLAHMPPQRRPEQRNLPCKEKGRWDKMEAEFNQETDEPANCLLRGKPAQESW